MAYLICDEGLALLLQVYIQAGTAPAAITRALILATLVPKSRLPRRLAGLYIPARRDKRFVAINCGALPDTLLESELFGYKAGAFTDARRDKPGRLAIADGGTIRTLLECQRMRWRS